MIQVAPSLLSADFANLGRDIEMLNGSAASMLHIDVMDGVFVPNISFGFPVMKYIQKLATKPLDVHLMIVDPQRYVSQVRDCGAEYMNVHYEACTHLHRVIQQIRDAGMKAAVTLNPATPVELLTDIISDLDMVLLMSVNPGFGGQKFIPHTINKLRRLKNSLPTPALTRLWKLMAESTLKPERLSLPKVPMCLSPAALYSRHPIQHKPYTTSPSFNLSHFPHLWIHLKYPPAILTRPV